MSIHQLRETHCKSKQISACLLNCHIGIGMSISTASIVGTGTIVVVVVVVVVIVEGISIAVVVVAVVFVGATMAVVASTRHSIRHSSLVDSIA